MYSSNKAPNSNFIGSENNLNLKIPQHIYKLLTKLALLEDKSNIESILKQFAHLTKYDEILKNIFYFFGWDDQMKSFTQPIKYEQLTAKIEREYEFSMNDHSNLEEKSNDDNLGGAGKLPLNVLDSENDPFFVKKPIALSTQVEKFQHNPITEQFLTNSAKIMYNDRVLLIFILGRRFQHPQ
jgi:hypothetical protein